MRGDVMRNVIGIVFAMVLGAAVAQSALNDVPDGVRRVLIENEVDDGSRRPLVELEYDEAGILVERRSFAFSSSNGALLRTTVERYAPNGEVLLRERLDGDGAVLEQTLVRTDEHGRSVASVTYDGDGAIASSWTATYADDGRHARVEHVEGDVLAAIDEVEIDAEGHVVASRSFDAAGNLQVVQQRDPETLTNEVTTYRDGVPVAISVQRFEALGVPTESIVRTPDGTVLSEVVHAYDAAGRLIDQVVRERVESGFDETVTRYAYENDEAGFWVVRQRLDGDGAVVATTHRSFFFDAP